MSVPPPFTSTISSARVPPRSATTSASPFGVKATPRGWPCTGIWRTKDPSAFRKTVNRSRPVSTTQTKSPCTASPDARQRLLEASPHCSSTVPSCACRAHRRFAARATTNTASISPSYAMPSGHAHAMDQTTCASERCTLITRPATRSAKKMLPLSSQAMPTPSALARMHVGPERPTSRSAASALVRDVPRARFRSSISWNTCWSKQLAAEAAPRRACHAIANASCFSASMSSVSCTPAQLTVLAPVSCPAARASSDTRTAQSR